MLDENILPALCEQMVRQIGLNKSQKATFSDIILGTSLKKVEW